jgi:hypothetical protein
VDLDASEEQLNENVRLLMKGYPQDVDVNLAEETKHFYANIIDNYSHTAKGHLNH